MVISSVRYWIDIFVNVQATGNTLLFFVAAISAIIAALIVTLQASWQLGLAILPLMPLTILSGIIQGYMNTGYEVKSHMRTEESGRVGCVLFIF